jgi:hypothetical protein
MAFGFPTPIQAAQNKVDQMLNMVQQGQGTACDAPDDAADPAFVATISAPPPGVMGGTTDRVIETQAGDVYEEKKSSALDGDQWLSFGKAPQIDY